MKTLSDYALDHGIQYRAAWNRFKTGKIPEAFQDESGRILIPEIKPEYTICYARVLSKTDTDRLAGQVRRLNDYCAAHGWNIDTVIKDIGPDPCVRPNKLLSILTNPCVTRIIVVNPGILSMYAFDLVKAWIEYKGCTIVVLDQEKPDKEDIVYNIIKLVSRFVSMLYGTRRSKYRASYLLREFLRDCSADHAVKNSPGHIQE